MRSFAVVAGFAAAALAAPAYDAAPAYPVASSSAPPAYVAPSAPAYGASTPAASSTAPGYAASSAPAYGASTPSAPGYAASSAPAYTTTKVISATTYECPEPTTVTYGPSTYVITSSTVLSIPQYTATYVHTPVATPVYSAGKPSYTPVASASKPAYTPAVPVASATKPAYSAAPPAPIYPSSNGTAPVVPVGTVTGTVPSATKSTSLPQFTGAAGKATVGFFAVAGAVAAFL